MKDLTITGVLPALRIKILLILYFTPEGNYNITNTLRERVVLRILLNNNNNNNNKVKGKTLSKPPKLNVTVPGKECILSLHSPLLGVEIPPPNSSHYLRDQSISNTLIYLPTVNPVSLIPYFPGVT